MERVIDKAIVAVCCLACLAVLPWEAGLLVALLCAVAATAFAELPGKRIALIPGLAYAAVALALPAFSPFLPVVAYDLFRNEHPLVRWCWTLPTLAALVRLPVFAAIIVVLACVVSCLLSFRTRRSMVEQAAYRRLHDDVREASLALEEKNRGLREKQDLEVHLATLAERDRIAREIHDNVGHLLTRSIMQVEALQVVHRDDEQVKTELAQVGATLHEAMSTVRASVHNLHDDAFDLRTQIEEAAAACVSLTVDIDYRTGDLPTDVGYSFIAMIREALSNAAKHGNASRVSVSVTSYPAFYRLVVHDNGSTPPPQAVLDQSLHADTAPRVGRGIGLVTMADRARALGGRCRVDYDQGFRVFVTIPKGEQL
ncbi:MAG: histidine kinase [Gordonibacter sp.]